MLRNPICLLLLAITGATLAAAPKPVTQFSSRDEYRACLDETDQMDLARSDYETQLAAHQKMVDQFELDATAHATKVNGQTAINFNNEKSAALSARSVELNAISRKLSLIANDFEAKVAAHNLRCAGMVVRLQDRELVHKECARQGKKI